MRPCILRFVLAALAPLGLACPLHADPFNTTFELLPAAPRYMEDVRLRVHKAASDCYRRGDVAMSGNKITLAVTRLVDLCPGDIDYDLGRFPAGEYSVEVVGATGVTGSQRPVLWTTSFAVPSRAIPSNVPNGEIQSDVNYTDLWWDPQRSGWGVMITHRPDDTLFAAWFDYGRDGQPVWYTFLGKPSFRGYIFTGQVLLTHGPNPASPPFESSTGISVVGEAVFRFGGSPVGLQGRYDRGSMSIDIGGIVHESPLQRFPFD